MDEDNINYKVGLPLAAVGVLLLTIDRLSGFWDFLRFMGDRFSYLSVIGVVLMIIAAIMLFRRRTEM